MARKESVVSRTVTFTKALCLVVDKTGETSDVMITIAGSFKDNEAILKKAKVYCNDNNLPTPVFVKESEVFVKRFAQYESDFINSDKTFELPPLVIKNQKDN